MAVVCTYCTCDVDGTALGHIACYTTRYSVKVFNSQLVSLEELSY